MKRRQTQVRCGGNHGQSRTGFSLLELMVVMLIIVLLTTLYWSPNSASHQRALKVACQKNLQKAYIALQIYANDNTGKFPQVASAHSSSEALDVLVPRYTSDTSIFLCPGSKDSDPLGTSLHLRKVSYAYYMGCSLTNSDAALMSDKQIDTLAKAAGEPAFSTTGKPPGNNHGKSGGNFLFCDGHLENSPAHVPFPLPLGTGKVLLNP